MSRLSLYLNAQNVMYEPDETAFGSINLRNVLKITILAAPYKKQVYYRTLEGVIHYHELHTKSKPPGKTE